jgi:hypothetical protein
VSNLLPCVFVESPADKLFVDVLLRPYPVEVVNGRTSSNMIGLAQFSLLEHPERPVAVLVNAEDGDGLEPNELRGTVKRLLARAAPDGWYVGVAIPRLDAWAMTDPRIKRDFESHFSDETSYADRAARFKQLTRSQPFDATELSRTNRDFRGLIDFIERHAPDSEAAEAQTSR